MGPVCPECATGKHANCDGVGYLLDSGRFLACECKEGEHPYRRKVVE